MKKSFKSLISILTVTIMLMAFAPGALASVPAATVTLFGSTSLAEGKTTAILNDNDFFMLGDINKGCSATYKNYVYSHTTDVPRGGVYVNENIDRVATFNAVNSGIDFTWTSGVTVKRLDLWILNAGGIGNFEVQTSADGTWTNPTVVASGSLDKNDNASVANTDQTLASYHPIIFEAPAYNVRYLRFVIKSFADAEKPYAYISEAKVLDTNEINLSQYQHPLYSTNKSLNQAYSPYLFNYESSARAASGRHSDKITDNYTGAYNGQIWSYVGDFLVENEVGKGIWYTTTFNKSKVKVNRIGLRVGTGTVKEFSVYVAEDNSKKILAGSNKKFTKPSYQNQPGAWNQTPIATFKCNLTKDSTKDEYTFDIPNAVEAAAICIVVTDYDAYDANVEGSTGTSIYRVNMYSVADYEINPGITKSDISGTVAAGETVTLNLATKELTNANAKVYFAVYSGDELKAATAVACPFTGTATYNPITYTIPADAGNNLTLKAFIWDGTTLNPLLNNPVVIDG